MLESLVIHHQQTALLFHATTEWLALSGGFMLYNHIRKRRGHPSALANKGGIWVLAFCLLGAGIGNKLVSILQFPEYWALAHSNPKQFWLVVVSGQSVVGGLLGGWLGVEIGKKIGGITSRTGDDFVAPILLGLVIGRTGCFVAGLYDGTYGVHTTLPWGVDFGDGARHPTQLYEWLAALVALVALSKWRQYFAHEQGLSFRVLMFGYLLWRLIIDSIKPVPAGWWLGMSGIQWVCLFALLVMAATYRRVK